jgi:hypothetical protein
MELETLLEAFLRQKQLKPPTGVLSELHLLLHELKTVAGDLETPSKTLLFLSFQRLQAV